jgi:hypothetical protein
MAYGEGVEFIDKGVTEDVDVEGCATALIENWSD